MKNPFLIGTQIYLRALDREDAPLLVTWVNDPEVTRTLEVFYRPRTLQQQLDFIETIYKSEHDIVFGIALKGRDALIGVTGLHQIHFKERHAVFAIFIGEKSEWGKGYGTEATALVTGYAFETLNLNRVSLQVYEYNDRGIKAYEKVGFKREGVLRQEHYYAGRYWDTIAMAILKEEWEARKRA
ncbi:MAG: GNAT family protein [Thermodesulfobacteriota bacterium]|jgi:RimJ/RimL family protein N-acetyltransferase